MAYKCPYESKCGEPNVYYYNSHCKEMQKSGIRVRCKTCPYFHNKEEKSEIKNIRRRSDGGRNQ